VNLNSVLEITTAPVSTVNPAQASAVLVGLSAQQKHLPPWLFYDAAGSRLFEEITRLPEYYLTAYEHAIFSRSAPEMIAAAAGPEALPLTVVELGAGSASKTLVLLRALVAAQGRATYLPVDVSEAALEWAGQNVRATLPTIAVQPICAEITHEKPLDLPQEGRRLALYIGSSIGNFDPEEAIALLQWLHSQLQPADSLLLGTDMVKDNAPLLAAYNDKAGVTAAFNKNILTRLNRELGANFAVDEFAHRAVWNAEASRMEMHLDSKRNQSVHIAALDRSFQFKRGESIHTESSYKFTPEAIEDILQKSGFSLEQSWYDRKHWFGVHLARVVDSKELSEEESKEEAA
jgi:L-histidine N-alpha-methyltransferase